VQNARTELRMALGRVAVRLLEKAHLLQQLFDADEPRRFLSSSRCASALLIHECKERGARLSIQQVELAAGDRCNSHLAQHINQPEHAYNSQAGTERPTAHPRKTISKERH
jgi:hypothetical protein